MRPVFQLTQVPKIIITDGAGTLFDKGSMVPAYAMQEAFDSIGVEMPMEVIMKYMGRKKREHIEEILLHDEIGIDAFCVSSPGGREANQDDVNLAYGRFLTRLYPAAARTTEIEEVKEAASLLKEKGETSLWMTTGYDRIMVVETIKAHSWVKEVLTGYVTNSDVLRGRPFEDMLEMVISHEGRHKGDVGCMFKAGDTLVDLEAADRIKMPAGLVLSGSYTKDTTGEFANRELDRKHLVAPSLAEILYWTMDGTIVDRVNSLSP